MKNEVLSSDVLIKPEKPASGRRVDILSVLLRGAVGLSALITVSVFVFICLYILINGVPNLRPELFSPNYTSDNVSMLPALINTCVVTLMSLAMAVPLGLASAIYLAEYAKRGNKLVKVIRMTSETLAGIPSIVYGLFGTLLFVANIGRGYSLLSGSLTLAVMILPLIMRTAEEALLSVPDSYREGAYGLGAGKLRAIFRIVLPSAVPGILAGVILAIGRIVGETAALIYTAGTVAESPDGLLSAGRTLAVHMYVLSSEGLHNDAAYATAVVLLVLVLGINTLSAVIAKRLTRA